MLKKIGFIIFLICIITLGTALPVLAEGKISLIVAESKVLPVKNVYRVAVADPQIADVVIVSNQEVILIGKGAGVTSLMLWNKEGRVTYQVKVLSQEVNLAREIQGTIGEEHVQVRMNNGTIVLEGKVKDQNAANRAEKISSIYGQKVINLLQLEKPLRVLVKAEIVEINKNAAQDLGINWGNYSVDSEGKIILGNAGDFLFGQVGTNGQIGKTGGEAKALLPVYAQIKALATNNQAKILSNPSILTLSGQKASFLAGGEIPVPVASEDNKIQVEWKEYGVKLEVEPIIDQLGNITAKVRPEVSTIDPANGIKVGEIQIPALRTRRVETEVQVPDGGTIAIGGLLQKNEATIVQKIPLLGDIPIIGQLFRSKSFLAGETELIVLVTFKNF